MGSMMTIYEVRFTEEEIALLKSALLTDTIKSYDLIPTALESGNTKLGNELIDRAIQIEGIYDKLSSIERYK